MLKVVENWVSGITEAHAQTDIDDAMAMGLTGFALNIGDLTAQYTTDCIGYLFPYAVKKGFKLFVSMDMAAATAIGLGVSDFSTILNDTLGSAAWYKGPNGYPYLSTFDSGGMSSAEWLAFKETWE